MPRFLLIVGSQEGKNIRLLGSKGPRVGLGAVGAVG